MQNDDGGWAAFDRTKDRPILEKIPFADHNAMQDPSCPDITGRVLECLGPLRLDRSIIRPLRRAIAFIRSATGSERRMVGPLGRQLRLRHLAGAHRPSQRRRRHEQPITFRRAADWLRSVQKPDGSFGETCRKLRRSLPQGQRRKHAIANRLGRDGLDGRRWRRTTRLSKKRSLARRQSGADGTGKKICYTGTGFPKVFYLKYHLYRPLFPADRAAGCRL